MQTNTDLEVKPSSVHCERVATVLQIAGWSSFVIQIGLAATSGVLLPLAI